jgi:hypothetical protein
LEIDHRARECGRVLTICCISKMRYNVKVDHIDTDVSHVRSKAVFLPVR